MHVLAQAVDLSQPACGHPAGFTVTRIVRGEPAIICQHCFEGVVVEDRAARLLATPVVAGLECLCGSSVDVRMNVDLGMGICDACRASSVQLLLQAEAKHVPRSDVVPEEVSPGVLFIGPKEAAFNRETLRRLGISHVLICCEVLPAYHHPADPTIRYHRLPLQDSLAQSLALYLPSALAFIAQAGLRGERCLVHCNAGVSRSGAIAVEWLRRTCSPPLTLDAALLAARQVRPIITPNSNFMDQLRALPE